MTPLHVRVIKLGGSLLDWPELAPRVRAWLGGQPPATNIVIVGGGPMVDKLRALDREHHFSPAAAHWLSIRAMSLTAAIVAEWLEEATLVSSLEKLRLAGPTSLQIFDVEHFLREDQGADGALPCGWEVTSDSIAARVAAIVSARELVLLKSALPAPGSSREAWARSGFVDAHFPRASVGLSVRCVNLRNPEFPQVAAD